MFTFSFSSAFAATAEETAKSYIEQAASLLANELEVAYNGAASYYVDNTNVESQFVSKATYAKVAEDVYDDYQDVIAIQKGIILALVDADGKISGAGSPIATLAAAKALFTGGAHKVTSTESEALENKYIGQVVPAQTFANFVMGDDYKVDALTYQFAKTKADVLAEIEKIDLSLYNATQIVTGDPFKVTYAKAAADAKAALADAANDVVLTVDDDQASEVADKIDDVLDYISSTYLVPVTGYNKDNAGALNNTYGTSEDIVYTYKFATSVATDKINGYTYDSVDYPILTAEDLGITGAGLDAEKASQKSAVATNTSTFYAKAYEYVYTASGAGYGWTSAEKTAFLNDVNKKLAAYAEVENAKIDAAETSPVAAPTVLTWNDSNITAEKIYTTNDLSLALKKCAKVDELESATVVYKAAANAAGELAYDAETIDDNLADLKETVYSAANGDAVDAVSTTALTVGAENGYNNIEFVKAAALAQIADNLEAKLYNADGTCKYYDKEKEGITALYNELSAKVEACTTSTQVAALGTTVVVSATKYPEKDAVEANIKTVKSFADEATAAADYLAYLNTGLTSIKDGYRDYNTSAVEDAIAEFYAKNDARTSDEVKAMRNEMLAYVATLPTKGEIAAAADAVEAMIKALPSTATMTLADKEAVKAAKEAYDDLDDQSQVLNYSTLVAAINFLHAKENTAIADAIKALPNAASVTAADKAAIEAAQAKVDAYEEETLYITAGSLATYTDSTGKLAAAWTALQNVEKAAVTAQIAALNENSTAAEVKAARDAYNAYVEYWTDYTAGSEHDAITDILNLSKLTAIEALFTMDEEAAKAYVQDLSIKARSVKTAKGVKVTIKADVQELLDAGFTVEYKFYRSTKSNKNFGTAKVTKTTNTYLNTAGKKGTKYYYKAKLVVKNAAGEVVATTPLTQCLYATRTF